jgi:hypothetical protein
MGVISKDIGFKIPVINKDFFVVATKLSFFPKDKEEFITYWNPDKYTSHGTYYNGKQEGIEIVWKNNPFNLSSSYKISNVSFYNDLQ